MNFHLHELGLGEIWYSKDSGRGYRMADAVAPEGLGVCRARILTEAAWPEGADLCVIVTWSPDEAYALRYWSNRPAMPHERPCRTRVLPAGAAEHWRERVAATAAALRSLGYMVEPSRFRTPECHAGTEFLVYRMPAGAAPRREPADADWALREPVPPHLMQPFWPYRERSPVEEVEAALRDAGLGRLFHGAGDSSAEWVAVRDITQTVWPPEAVRCAWVVWSPAARFARDRETGAVPEGADDHWRTNLALVLQAVQAAGFAYRVPERTWNPRTHDAAHLLVHRSMP